MEHVLRWERIAANGLSELAAFVAVAQERSAASRGRLRSSPS